MAKSRLQITLDHEIVALLDDLARKMGLSRSAVVSLLISREAEQQK